MARGRRKKNITLPAGIVFVLSGLNTMLEFSTSIVTREAVNSARKDYRLRREAQEEEIKERKKIKQALRRLERAEEVTFNKRENEYRLTPAGWLKFVKYYNQHNKKTGSKGKKGHFIIMFDVPEEHRRFRNLFRTCLMNLGCEYIQKSNFYTDDRNVFLFTQKMVANCELTEYVRFVEAKNIF